MAKKRKKSAKTGPKTNWKLTPDTVRKLEEAFAIDASVEEACFYADISRETFYQWIKVHVELADKFERLRNRPILKARQTIVNKLDNPENAKWYLERKKKVEFAQRTELTADKGESLALPPDLDALIKKAYGSQATPGKPSGTAQSS